MVSKSGLLLAFFLGPLLAISLLMFRRTCLDRRTRFLMIAGAFFMLGFLANAFKHAHYLAPITALVYCLVVQSMRHLRLWRPGGDPAGIFLVRAIFLFCGAMGLVQIAWSIATPTGDLPRTGVLHALATTPGRHLVIVGYGPRHDSEKEWVFNAADIDASPVVWARDMGPAGNQDLICYFRDRQIWTVNADGQHPQLTLYDGKARAVSRTP
jgi:predicted small integral membrane protein